MRSPRRVRAVRPSSYSTEVEAADEASVEALVLASAASHSFLLFFLFSLQPRGLRRVCSRRRLVQARVGVRLPLRQGVP